MRPTRSIPVFLGLTLTLLMPYSAESAPPDLPTTTPASSLAPATQPDRRAAFKGVKFQWLVLNCSSQHYSTTVDINGKRYASYPENPAKVHEYSSGLQSLPFPFKEGDNQIRIAFVPQPGDGKFPPEARLPFLLSPTMWPGNGPVLTLVKPQIDNDFGEMVIDVQFKQTQPVAMRLKESHWADAHHKHLTWSVSADGDGINDFEHKTTAVWTPEGKPFAEREERRGLTLTAKCYKPDGTLGAEVKNGDGFRREFFEDGSVAIETPYQHGRINGERKEFFGTGKVSRTTQCVAGQAQGQYRQYDRDGKLQVSGSYKADQMDGTWIRYDPQGKEVARSVFETGKLIKGNDQFADQ